MGLVRNRCSGLTGHTDSVQFWWRLAAGVFGGVNGFRHGFREVDRAAVRRLRSVILGIIFRSCENLLELVFPHLVTVLVERVVAESGVLRIAATRGTG